MKGQAGAHPEPDFSALSSGSAALRTLVDSERMAVVELLSEHAPDGWYRAYPSGATSSYNGAGTFTANGISLSPVALAQELPATLTSDAEVSALAKEFTAVAAPWGLQVRNRPHERVRRLARTLGLDSEVHVPTMVAMLAGERVVDAGHVDLVVEPVRPDQADEFAEVMARGFQMPVEQAFAFASEALLSLPGVAAYWGRISDGTPVSVGVAIEISPGISGLYAISTVPEFRNRGYGAAITDRLLRHAEDRGAAIAYLQASSMGQPVYSRLGFEVAEVLTYFV